MAVNKLALEDFSFLLILPLTKTYECYNKAYVNVFFIIIYLFIFAQLKKIP